MAAGRVVRQAAAWRTGTGGPGPASEVAWQSSDAVVLRVSEDGERNAARPGSAPVMATLADQTAEAQYQGTWAVVASVRILPRITALGVGDEARLEAQAGDRLGVPPSGRAVSSHSSDTKVVVV